MTKKELIELIEEYPDDAVITCSGDGRVVLYVRQWWTRKEKQIMRTFKITLQRFLF